MNKVLKANELLKKARKKLAWSQQQTGVYFKVRPQIISYWELGQRPIPEDVIKFVKGVLRTNKRSLQKRYLPYAKTPKVLNSLGEKYSSEKGLVPKLPKKDTYAHQLLENMINHQKKEGHYPTLAEFREGKIKTYGLKEIVREFGGIGRAKTKATALNKLQVQERKQTRQSQRRAVAKQRPKICPTVQTIPQTAITPIDPNNKLNWLEALYPQGIPKNSTRGIPKVERTFKWEEVFLYRQRGGL